jgi:hypothetical protein
MMNLTNEVEGMWNEAGMAYFKVLSLNFFWEGGTEGNRETLGAPTFRPRFERWTSQIRSRSVSHPTATSELCKVSTIMHCQFLKINWNKTGKELGAL